MKLHSLAHNLSTVAAFAFASRCLSGRMLWLDQKKSLRVLSRVEDLRLETCNLKPALLTATGWLEMHADVTFQQLSVHRYCVKMNDMTGE